MTGVGLFLNVSAFFMYHTIPVFLYKLPKSRGSGSKFPGGRGKFFYNLYYFDLSYNSSIPIQTIQVKVSGGPFFIIFTILIQQLYKI